MFSHHQEVLTDSEASITLDAMTNQAKNMRRIGREALRLSTSAPTAVERGEAARLYERIVANLRADRDAAQS